MTVTRMLSSAALAFAAFPQPVLAASMFGPDNETFWGAMAGFIVIGMLAPIGLAVVSGRTAKRNRIEDTKRQDRVAALLLEANKIAGASAKVVVGKLDVITTMVDGSMTQAIINDHKSSVALLVALELAERQTAPDAERAAQIEVLKARIPELEKIIADRLRQVALAENQAKQNIHMQGELAGREGAQSEAAAAVELAEKET